MSTNKASVVKASRPYLPGILRSLDRTQTVLIRQHEFPVDWFRDEDQLLGMFLNECSQKDASHLQRALKQHTGKTSSQALDHWARRVGPEVVMAFLIDALKAKERYPEVRWSGFRILGSANVRSGCKTFLFQLFANRSGVDTYSDDRAPNVEAGVATVDQTVNQPLWVHRTQL